MNTGGPAFPQSDPVANEFHKKYGTDRGMTLRDYFAAKAMQGLLAGKLTSTNLSFIAADCYKMADAMLKAREQ